ncbi:NAD(P)H-hydrate epimerase [Candidatus Dojkabacteria bacterium]|uniref:NAD(P)H-hydrate epimerase n=1 Tax=Candidatus Dojkabacteria bacterium TaxID=2099670 RepID=A0A955LB59_9BACT|nr:NAD(P)H-hydrate epimerase [Candidatus Dojkabacteria bacterium]
MERKYTESDILLKNAESLGIDLIAFYDEVGRLIAEKLVSTFGKNKSYGIICGKGGNAADGLATAFHLACMDVSSVTVFLATRKNQFDSTFAEDVFYDVEKKAKESKNLTIKNDCFANDIQDQDIMVEALVGTGFEGEVLHKRFKDIIKRVSHFKAPLIAIDVSVPNYNPTKTYSLFYPKAKNAFVIDLKLPKELDMYCGPGEREALWVPNKTTHKSKNGNLLYFSQDDKNNDCVISASKDYTTNLSIFTFEHINDNVTTKKRITSAEIASFVDEADTIFLGDIDNELIQYATVKHIMQQFHGKTWVITGESVSLIDLMLLEFVENIVFVLSLEQLGILFRESNPKLATFEGKVKRFCIQNKVNMVLVGNAVTMYNVHGEMKRVPLTAKDPAKATFDMASYIAAFSTKNDLWLSMRAVMG